VLVDKGILVAAADSSEARHDAARAVLESEGDKIVTERSFRRHIV
jgi:predicted nucleic acid-binding protein